MEKKRINRRKKKISIVLVTLLVLIVGVILFILVRNKSNEQKQPDNTICVETPYCNLYYPDQWKDNVLTEVDETDGYRVTFIANINNQTANLFSVSFGENESMQIGKFITDNNEEISVGVEFFTLEETLEWVESDSVIAHEMRNAGNDLVEYLEGQLDAEE